MRHMRHMHHMHHMHRMHPQVVGGAKHLKVKKVVGDAAPRNAWLGAFTFSQLGGSVHTQAPPLDLQHDETRWDKPVGIDGEVVMTQKQRQLLKFKSGKRGSDLGVPGLVSPEEAEAQLSSAFMTRETGLRRGGGGTATVLCVWDSGAPHGTGKAKFIMDRGYDPGDDP